jgi:xylan 1,4-beta-xylosidase
VNALATRSERTISILVWNYHDDDLPAPPANVELAIDGVPGRSVDVTHERVDATHGNAYEAWKRMGSPQPPTKAQQKALERAGQLQALEPPKQLAVAEGRVRLVFALPRQAVSLLRLTW